MLERDDAGWVATEFAQGDVCAPSELAAEVRDRYLAFLDAVWSAADPPDRGIPDWPIPQRVTTLRVSKPS